MLSYRFDKYAYLCLGLSRPKRDGGSVLSVKDVYGR